MLQPCRRKRWEQVGEIVATDQQVFQRRQRSQHFQRPEKTIVRQHDILELRQSSRLPLRSNRIFVQLYKKNLLLLVKTNKSFWVDRLTCKVRRNVSEFKAEPIEPPSEREFRSIVTMLPDVSHSIPIPSKVVQLVAAATFGTLQPACEAPHKSFSNVVNADFC